MQRALLPPLVRLMRAAALQAGRAAWYPLLPSLAMARNHGAVAETEASAPAHGTFGPHPAAPGPAPAAAPAPRGPAPATSPAPGYPESELLAEERLRERLASILRADGLRHGLDLKGR